MPPCKRTPIRKRTVRRHVVRRPNYVHHVMKHTFSSITPHVYPHLMFYPHASLPLPKDSIHNYQPHPAAHNHPPAPHMLPPQVSTPAAHPSMPAPASPTLSPRNLFTRKTPVDSMSSPSTNFKYMKIPKLREYAAKRTIKLHSKMRKDDIVCIICEDYELEKQRKNMS